MCSGYANLSCNFDVEDESPFVGLLQVEAYLLHRSSRRDDNRPCYGLARVAETQFSRGVDAIRWATRDTGVVPVFPESAVWLPCLFGEVVPDSPPPEPSGA